MDFSARQDAVCRPDMGRPHMAYSVTQSNPEAVTELGASATRNEIRV